MELADWQMWWKRSGAHELRAIMTEEWDPIGLRGIPEAADEYDGYLHQVPSRLRARAKYLTELEEDRMGLGHSPNARARDQALADRLRAWYAEEMAASGADRSAGPVFRNDT
jgi:hypothetical protein